MNKAKERISKWKKRALWGMMCVGFITNTIVAIVKIIHKQHIVNELCLFLIFGALLWYYTKQVFGENITIVPEELPEESESDDENFDESIFNTADMEENLSNDNS